MNSKSEIPSVNGVPENRSIGYLEVMDGNGNVKWFEGLEYLFGASSMVVMAWRRARTAETEGNRYENRCYP
jgi:hypothetical protein